MAPAQTVESNIETGTEAIVNRVATLNSGVIPTASTDQFNELKQMKASKEVT